MFLLIINVIALNYILWNECDEWVGVCVCVCPTSHKIHSKTCKIKQGNKKLVKLLTYESTTQQRW